jgi:hypothetical protein
MNAGALGMGGNHRATRVAVLHYSAPPVIGGVEAVIQAHLLSLQSNGYPATVIAGRGEANALPPGADFLLVPEMDSQHPEIRRAGEILEGGSIPAGFGTLTDRLVHRLGPILAGFDLVILHNLFTKHFNLPLTAALHRLLDAGAIRRCIAWCHDLSWTSPSSREKVHPGYPWDLLRTFRPEVSYVVVSEERRRRWPSCSASRPAIRVIYNGSMRPNYWAN